MKPLICFIECFFVASFFTPALATIELKEKITLKNAHTDIITSVSVSYDGKVLISGGLDAAVRYWDFANLDKRRRITSITVPQNCMWVNTQASIRANIIPVLGQNIVKLLSTNEAVRTSQVLQLNNGNNKVTALTPSPSGNLTAVGFTNGFTLLFDNTTGKSRTLKRHRTAVTALAFSKDELLLASGDDEGVIALWDIVSSTETPRTTLIRHSMPIVFLAFYNDGANLISAAQDNNCRIWDVNSKKDVKTFTSTVWTNQMLALSPDETVLAQVNSSGISFIAMADFRTVVSLPTRNQASALVFSSDGKYFCAAMKNGDITVWDVEGVEAEPLRSLPPELLVFEPTIIKDARGMKLAVSREGEDLPVSGIIGSTIQVDSVLVNGTSAAMTAASAENIQRYNMKHKYVYQYSSMLKLPAGLQRISIAAYDKRRQRIIDSVSVNVEQKKGTLSVTSQRRADIHAFVVGISRYEEAAYNLKYASEDARFFVKKLRDPAAGDIALDKITYLYDEDATKESIMDKLEDRFKNTFPNDVIIIYFACHGFAEKDEIYYMAYDTNPNKLRATGLRSRDVLDIVTEYGKDRKVIMFFDACNSGGTGQQLASRGEISTAQINEFYEEIGKESNFIATMTASSKGELSYEGEEYGGGHGVFTYYLGIGLSGAANSDLNQYITIGELYQFARKKVREATGDKQSPTFNFNQSAGSVPLDLPLAIVK